MTLQHLLNVLVQIANKVGKYKNNNIHPNTILSVEVEVEVTLRLTVSQYVLLSGNLWIP
jgi:hypothetical protein